MKTYRSLTQSELGLHDDEWADLTEFVSDAQQQIEATDGTGDIESHPPTITKADSPNPVFHPGGWVGAYPGDIHVYPDKINQLEYEYIVEEVAGWFELWDIPTAAAVLPLVNAGMIDSRSVVVGYSSALISYTEEALAHRPPTNISRETVIGDRLNGALNLQDTIKAQSRGSQKIAYDELDFSLRHPTNLLLLQFHMQLSQELNKLLDQSFVMTSTLEEHLDYHRRFLSDEFTDEMLDIAIQKDFTDPSVLNETRRESPQGLGELVDLWEAYLRDQTLSIDFRQQLDIGVKPIEKLYELWLLDMILEILSEIVEPDVETVGPDHEVFELGDSVTVYYNKALYSQSQILASGFDTHPGRPDYAIAIDDTIVWVGDAKFRHEADIELESYQRFLSYTVDLLSLDEHSVGSILYVGEESASPSSVTADVTVEQLPIRPKQNTTQRQPLRERLQKCLRSELDQ